MNFDFSAEQTLLRAELRKVLTDICPPTEIRRVLDGAASHADNAWRQLGALGYLGAAIPEQYGGQGLGYLELCIIAEEIGRSLAPVPFSSSLAFATPLLLLGASESQKAKWLPRLAQGKAIACVAFAEPESDGRTVPRSCVLHDGRLTGRTSPVLDGGIADLALVICNGGVSAGASLVIADLLDTKVGREAVVTIDPARNHAKLHFDAAPVELLGNGIVADGYRLFEVARDHAAILMAFEQLGGADRSLELARDYALERQAFGRTIGSFQAIKHKLVDIYTGNTLARGHAYYGAWAMATQSPTLPLAAAAARSAATAAYCTAAQEALHIHGGIGFTWAHYCHLYLRRSRLLASTLGSESEWKERLVQQLELSHSEARG